MATRRRRPRSTSRAPAKKIFYKIGEAAALLGVEAYVLRYWESQFPSFRPDRTKSGQRHYRQAHIDEALRIQGLVHGEGLRIAAAKKHPRSKASAASPPISPSRERALRRAVAEIEKILDDDEKAL